MTQLNELKLLNDSNILYLKKLNKNYEKNEIIQNILNDESCFFKMNKNDAYIILKDIGILDEQIDSIYQKLISSDVFYNLLNQKKLDLNDETLLIKYPLYDADELFKNKNNNAYIDEYSKDNTQLTSHKQSFIKRFFNKIKNIVGKKK